MFRNNCSHVNFAPYISTYIIFTNGGFYSEGTDAGTDEPYYFPELKF